MFGTRYGATADTSEVIADMLRQEEFDVRVVDARKDKVKSISEFELVVVGSGIQMGRWTKEPEKFLRRFQEQLSKKKVAIFVCCGGANPLAEGEEKTKEIEDAKRKYLEDKAVQYDLEPIALGFFGGIYDFNKMFWFLRKTMSGVKPKLEEAGFKETKNGFCDTRNLDAISNWAKEVAQMVI